jgi:hypothetical protein
MAQPPELDVVVRSARRERRQPEARKKDSALHGDTFD